MSFWKKKRESSSSSEKWTKRSRELLLLFAGLALTLAAILLARQRIAAAERDLHRKVAPVEIVVPSIAIPAGGVFTETNLAKKSVPASGTSIRNVPAGEFELLIGARAKANLTAGDPILWTDVEEPYESEMFSQTIPSGRRAFTLEATASSSFAGLIRPGDIVDLFFEGERGNSLPGWIQGIAVISVDRHFSRNPSKEDIQDISTITVSVSPKEGMRLAAAAQAGRIHWFLRNPDEPPNRRGASGPPDKSMAGNIEIWKAGVQELRMPIPGGES